MTFKVTQKLQMCLNPNLVLSTVAFQHNVRNQCTDNANETDGHTHCHVIEINHIKSAIDKLKSSKIDQNGCIFSDNIIHGTELLFDFV